MYGPLTSSPSSGGHVDSDYKLIVEQSERRKMGIDREAEAQLRAFESTCEKLQDHISKQAEYHLQIAKQHLDARKKQHVHQLKIETGMHKHAISHRAELAKAKTIEEACKALKFQSNKKKKKVHKDGYLQTEAIWCSASKAFQESFRQQTEQARDSIEKEIQQRISEIDAYTRDIALQLYNPPHPSSVLPSQGSECNDAFHASVPLEDSGHTASASSSALMPSPRNNGEVEEREEQTLLRRGDSINTPFPESLKHGGNSAPVPRALEVPASLKQARKGGRYSSNLIHQDRPYKEDLHPLRGKTHAGKEHHFLFPVGRMSGGTSVPVPGFSSPSMVPRFSFECAPRSGHTATKMLRGPYYRPDLVPTTLRNDERSPSFFFLRPHFGPPNTGAKNKNNNKNDDEGKIKVNNTASPCAQSSSWSPKRPPSSIYSSPQFPIKKNPPGVLPQASTNPGLTGLVPSYFGPEWTLGVQKSGSPERGEKQQTRARSESPPSLFPREEGNITLYQGGKETQSMYDYYRHLEQGAGLAFGARRDEDYVGKENGMKEGHSNYQGPCFGYYRHQQDERMMRRTSSESTIFAPLIQPGGPRSRAPNLIGAPPGSPPQMFRPIMPLLGQPPLQHSPPEYLSPLGGPLFPGLEEPAAAVPPFLYERELQKTDTHMVPPSYHPLAPSRARMMIRPVPGSPEQNSTATRENTKHASQQSMRPTKEISCPFSPPWVLSKLVYPHTTTTTTASSTQPTLRPRACPQPTVPHSPTRPPTSVSPANGSSPQHTPVAHLSPANGSSPNLSGKKERKNPDIDGGLRADDESRREDASGIVIKAASSSTGNPNPWLFPQSIPHHKDHDAVLTGNPTPPCLPPRASSSPGSREVISDDEKNERGLINQHLPPYHPSSISSTPPSPNTWSYPAFGFGSPSRPWSPPLVVAFGSPTPAERPISSRDSHSPAESPHGQDDDCLGRTPQASSSALDANPYPRSECAPSPPLSPLSTQ